MFLLLLLIEQTVADTMSTNTSMVDQIDKPTKSNTTWNEIFRPPTPPPLCSGHKERCLIRQVKDASSTNWGRYFYVCARANGASDNPQARCDHFQWKDAKKKLATKK
jgi:AP endonuclease 2